MQNNDNTVADDIDKQTEEMESSKGSDESSSCETDFLLIPTIKSSHGSSFGCPGNGAFFFVVIKKTT